uniref:Uncharacterized protein n=1 Tax=Rhizophora mucronata TaxID=61149 RepID=A0A2P2Q5D1_RHIMU
MFPCHMNNQMVLQFPICSSCSKGFIMQNSSR